MLAASNRAAQRYGSAAGGGAGPAGLDNSIISQNPFGRAQTTRPLEPGLGGLSYLMVISLIKASITALL